MKFNGKNINYVKLDDDVSFQILRTNPKLTSNVKLIYDGEKLFLESYSASPILSNGRYKGVSVNPNGLYNSDLRRFLSGTMSAAFEIGENFDDTSIAGSFDYQYENMYWCGTEAVRSNKYPQELGIVAPIYLRKKLPEYFVIFKIDSPSNTNLTAGSNDISYDFRSDIMKNAKIIKSFNLGETTPLGKYIRNYTGQTGFRFDQSVYVNFSSNEMYFYGIDRTTGVMTRKVENFKEQLLDNDNTILRTDNWITGGFERNGLVFPYVINLEFLFDDRCEEYTFGRYFGMYCNAIDLLEMDVNGFEKSVVSFDFGQLDRELEFKKLMESNKQSFFYMKDKNDVLYGIDMNMHIYGDVDESEFIGYGNEHVSVKVERFGGLGHSHMILKVLGSGTITVNGKDIELAGQSGNECAADMKVKIESSEEFGSSLMVDAYDDIVDVKSRYSGSGYDGSVAIDGDSVEHITDRFGGGTDAEWCRFVVSSDDVEIFRSDDRYLKTKKGKPAAKIIDVSPLVHDDGIDMTHFVVSTDWCGQYVRTGMSGQVDVLDRYHAGLGILSMFPVKDFDFDTVESRYGKFSSVKNEYDMGPEIVGKIGSNSKVTMPAISYMKFSDDDGNSIDTEYDYFCENILKELTTVNKTVPFISKWGYVDDSKDACENPYRLNMSKIFGTCNFSPNTYVREYDIEEYTHQMPYYVISGNDGLHKKDINEYQYIVYDDIQNVNGWKTLFSDETDNNFEKVFETRSEMYGNKRFDRKYSRFMDGGVGNPYTLFRGVRFEISDSTSSKNSIKYVGYKFSVMCVYDKNVSDPGIWFIKNDKYRFVVGIMYMNVHNADKCPIGRLNIHLGCNVYLRSDDKNNDNE